MLFLYNFLSFIANELWIFAIFKRLFNESHLNRSLRWSFLIREASLRLFLKKCHQQFKGYVYI